MKTVRSTLIEGWPLLGGLTLSLLLMTFFLLATTGFDADGSRMVIRATARTSAVLFGLAFIASALALFFRHVATAWLLRNRRYLGLSFGVSHTIHYFAVLGFMILDPGAFVAESGELGPEKIIPVLMLVLLMGTAFDRTAAMLGPVHGKRLYLVGIYFFWIIFTVTFGVRAADSVLHAGFTAFMLVIMMIRLTAIAVRRFRPLT
jgi:hypothetical protein